MDVDEPLKVETTPEVFTKRDLICCSGPSGQDQEVEISEPFASLVALSFASPLSGCLFANFFWRSVACLARVLYLSLA